MLSFIQLRKSKKVLRKIDRLYQKKWKVLDASAKEKIITHLDHLRAALKEKDSRQASICSKELQEAAKRLMPETAFEKIRNSVSGLAVALIIAIVIRQMWFELYSIPTGSMRPTLKESDFLVVSKTDFSVNVPLQPSHFMFDESLVKRGSIVVWTGANMDIPDSDTVYFYLFPGKKLFVKRLMGKPGDTLYFYGGKIYGIDRDGKELTELRQSDWAQNLEHIPFIHFDGRVETSDLQGKGIFTTSTFKQMNLPIAKLKASVFGTMKGEMSSGLPEYSDLWGMKNYAMARLLNQAELEAMHPGASVDKGLLYLELTHHPSLKEGRLVRDNMNRIRPDLGTSVSLIALQKEHVQAIADHMITCRFTVQNGKAFHLGLNLRHPYARYFPTLSGVADGTYEIQDGKAYRVYPMGITKELSKDHPLYNKDPAFVQTLYNLGIEFLTSTLYPSRYAYFRDGDLYLLRAPILHKDDPTLVAYAKGEAEKKVPFIDAGAPLNSDGTLDKDFVRKYGVVIPDKMYLMLGDNHAMSADSRQFGFVPQDNLKGVLSFLFSPPGNRLGKLPQAAKDHFTFPTLFVWGSAFVLIGGYTIYRRRKQTKF